MKKLILTILFTSTMLSYSQEGVYSANHSQVETEQAFPSEIEKNILKNSAISWIKYRFNIKKNDLGQDHLKFLSSAFYDGFYSKLWAKYVVEFDYISKENKVLNCRWVITSKNPKKPSSHAGGLYDKFATCFEIKD